VSDFFETYIHDPRWRPVASRLTAARVAWDEVEEALTSKLRSEGGLQVGRAWTALSLFVPAQDRQAHRLHQEALASLRTIAQECDSPSIGSFGFNLSTLIGLRQAFPRELPEEIEKIIRARIDLRSRRSGEHTRHLPWGAQGSSWNNVTNTGLSQSTISTLRMLAYGREESRALVRDIAHDVGTSYQNSFNRDLPQLAELLVRTENSEVELPHWATTAIFKELVSPAINEHKRFAWLAGVLHRPLLLVEALAQEVQNPVARRPIHAGIAALDKRLAQDASRVFALGQIPRGGLAFLLAHPEWKAFHRLAITQIGNTVEKALSDAPRVVPASRGVVRIRRPRYY